MSSIVREVLLILFLVLLNGVFAMSEIAVVSARKARLQERAERGSRQARRALRLAEEPNRFLATVQVGITLIGILAGAFGGATLAEHATAWVATSRTLAPYAEAIGLGVVVLGITYLSLVLGELVPKRIGLNAPERIAALVAGPMNALSVVGRPLVTLLTWSTEVVMRLLPTRRGEEPPVTEAEIAVLLEQGTEAGVFQEEEQALVERVFWLADQRVVTVMTPRVRVAWLDVDDPPERVREQVLAWPYSRFPVCEGSLDRVVGVLEVRDLWAAGPGSEANLRALLREALFVPESTTALALLERFREGAPPVAVVVDEYGGMEGVVTLHDLLEALVGDLRVPGAAAEPSVVRREDGSYLVDGAILMDELRDVLGLEERRGEERGEYRTLGGLVFSALGRVPRSGDHFVSGGFRFEVVDMDRNRIDKVLVARVPRPPHGGGEGDEDD